MAADRYKRLRGKINQALEEKPKRDALYVAMKRGRDSRRAAVAARPDGDAFRADVRATKLQCIEKLPELVEKFAAKVRERGGQVYMAKDGTAAIEYILDVCRKKNAKSVAKSKSLTSEEILVNEPLEANGIKVIETDLGELIIQKVHEKPYHLVFPAVHKTAVQVAEIFKKETGEDIPPDAGEIMKVVRRYLRPIFLNADIGMTGANVGIAETGAIVIETNEGNARLVSSIPDVHICIMGMEKVVGTVEEALKMVMAHPVSAVGQMLTTYVTFMAGRSQLGDGEGRSARETHIIILDNGRSAMRDDPNFSDALNCIRCGACMNICPTYGVVGGHAFGYIYPGPIGIPWTAEVHGLEKAGDFAPLCISCGLCKEICPAKIDIPMMIAEVKDRDAQNHPAPFVNKTLMMAEEFAGMGSMTAPLSNWMLGNSLFRMFLEKFAGIDRRRTLPPFARKTFMKQFRALPPDPPAKGGRKVAYFVDIFANNNAPQLGMAAVQRLREKGCEVIVPPQKSCGYPFIGYGDLKRARETAEYNVNALVDYARKGYDIVATEPTAAYCLKLAYPKLLHSDESKLVSERAYEIFDYLELLEVENPSSAPLKGKRFGFHVSCHQRPLSAGNAAMNWLRRRGAEVELIETGTCCGMGGTFGMKAGALGYDLSRAVGEPLFQKFAEAKVDAIVTESSVCTMHLKDGTQMKVFHPLELLMQ
ncbi:MAG TPA: LUD domain-containing protein [Candidatus Sumerlaeota bacterium]|nr:LUD domain-containing protein [Candidatus Sumerlaeota bacterium]